MASPLLGVSPPSRSTTMESADALRERADVADLDRHLRNDAPSWQDARALPPLPNLSHRSASFTDAQEESRADIVAESRRLRQPGGFRRGHLDANAENEGRSAIPTLMENLHNPEPNGSLFDFSEKLGANARSITNIYEAQFGRNDTFIEDDNCDVPVTHKLNKLGMTIALIKGNIGAGVLFQPSAWKAGGYVFTTVLLPAVGCSAILCAMKLIRVRMLRDNCSYGDMMFEALGRPGSIAINTSIFLLQVGSCCSYIALIAQTLQETLLPRQPLWLLICSTAACLVPLALVRKISKLAPLNLLGVFTTFVGLAFVLAFEFEPLFTAGVPWDDRVPVQVDGVLVSLGIACFTFEGIGTVLPVYDAAEDKASYSRMYVIVVFCICMTNTTVGLIGYLAFGEETASFVLLNLPQGLFVTIIKLAYAVAVTCTFPLVLLPALRISEDLLFGLPTSSPPCTKKCVKNLFRTLFVATMAVLTYAASSSLDHFVSIIGASCGIPLAFVYPAVVHMRIHPDLRLREKIVDMMVLVAGIILTIAVTVNGFITWGA